MTGWAAPGFSWPVRIYWEDTDGGGVVYYANYLKFLERARTEWLRSLGIAQNELAKDPGVVFVVSNITVDYRRPARLDDALVVTCQCERDRATCIRFEQRILRNDELIAEAAVRVVCIDAKSFRPTRLPAAVVNAVSVKEPV